MGELAAAAAAGEAPDFHPNTGVENLVPDFSGRPELLAEVFESRPEVFAHNVETVPRIFKRIRPAFRYERSLDVIRQARDFGLITKSNLILGMGETPEEIRESLTDLHSAGCDIITITQYLRPGPMYHPIDRWVKPEEFVEHKEFAEELGFDTLWMLDSHLLFREVYTMFGAIGALTDRIRLGTAVTNPLTRHPTVTASAFATLAELTGGRATLGISVGDSALKAMNLEIAKMSTLADTVRRCRALLAGESVSFSEGEVAKLHHVGRHVPIYVAATGPKMLHLTGAIGDGCILMNGVAPDLIKAAMDLLHEGEQTLAQGGDNFPVRGTVDPVDLLVGVVFQIEQLRLRVTGGIRQAGFGFQSSDCVFPARGADGTRRMFVGNLNVGLSGPLRMGS